MVSEPSVEDTIAILRGLKPRCKAHHKGVRIRIALVAAANLSHRYIADRFLPDKAIDLMDEATSRLAMELESVPTEIDEVQRRLVQLELADRQLADETEEHAQQRRTEVQEEIAELRKKLADLRQQWELEKSGLGDVQQVRQRLMDVELQCNQLAAAIKEKQSGGIVVPEADYQRLYELDLQRRGWHAAIGGVGGEQKAQDWPPAGGKEDRPGRNRRSRRRSGPASPYASMMETERAKLLVLEDRIHQRLIGQDEAVEAVANAVRRNRSGLQDPNRPIGSFIFLGPTGVGKTELCKALAEVMFDDENAMIRLDMSKFMERHTVSRLIGTPPGYVGYEEGGMLTEAIRRRPYAVILLDEIEKANRDVFNILLQVLDDGRLSDNQGHTVDFTNTIVVMTSNIGSQVIQEIGKEGGSEEQIHEAVMETLQTRFLPEFLNRVDEIMIFHPLTPDDIQKIVHLQIERLRKQLADKGIAHGSDHRGHRRNRAGRLRSELRRPPVETRDPTADSKPAGGGDAETRVRGRKPREDRLRRRRVHVRSRRVANCSPARSQRTSRALLGARWRMARFAFRFPPSGGAAGNWGSRANSALPRRCPPRLRPFCR